MKNIKKQREIHSLDIAIVLFFNQLRLIAIELSKDSVGFDSKYPVDNLKVNIIGFHDDGKAATVEIRHSHWPKDSCYIHLMLLKKKERWLPNWGSLFAPPQFLDHDMYYNMNFTCNNLINGNMLITPDTNDHENNMRKIKRKVAFLNAQKNIFAWQNKYNNIYLQ